MDSDYFSLDFKICIQISNNPYVFNKLFDISSVVPTNKKGV